MCVPVHLDPEVLVREPGRDRFDPNLASGPHPADDGPDRFVRAGHRFRDYRSEPDARRTGPTCVGRLFAMEPTRRGASRLAPGLVLVALAVALVACDAAPNPSGTPGATLPTGSSSLQPSTSPG